HRRGDRPRLLVRYDATIACPCDVEKRLTGPGTPPGIQTPPKPGAADRPHRVGLMEAARNGRERPQGETPRVHRRRRHAPPRRRPDRRPSVAHNRAAAEGSLAATRRWLAPALRRAR